MPNPKVKMLVSIAGRGENGKAWSLNVGDHSTRFTAEEAHRMFIAQQLVIYSNERRETPERKAVDLETRVDNQPKKRAAGPHTVSPTPEFAGNTRNRPSRKGG